MTKITVSFEFEGSNAELIAQIANLLHEPVAVEKVAKVRKTRIMTDEQKAAFRARMIAGRSAKALAENSKAVTKPEPKVEPVVISAPVKPVAKPKQVTKVPMLRTGRKVKARPSAQ
jgi:hypothetical protein